MERLNALDVWFLNVETDVDHLHIGSVGIFAGPPPEYRALSAAIEARLPALPRYRQRVQHVPLGLGRPVWVDDPHFRLSYHLRHSALPAPGGEVQLRNLVGRVMSQQLDQRRPLWETWVVEGLEGGRWALLTKVHHCMVDGVAGTELLATILDPEPVPPPAPPLEPWVAEPTPSRIRLAAEAVVDGVAGDGAAWRGALAAARSPRRTARSLATIAHGAVAMTSIARPTAASSLSGPVGPHLRWAWARADFADVKQIREGLGGTVNDVVLTAISAGFRDLLVFRGEELHEYAVRSLVPVSIRTDGERGVFNNRVAAMFVRLPVDVADPRERHAAVQERMARLKRSRESHATEALVSLSGVAPPFVVGALLRAGTRYAGRFGQRNVNTVTTNVPGPQQPLYLLGRRMEEAFPFVPIAESVRIGIAIFSYDGKLTFGVTGDYDTTEDVDVFTAGIENGMIDLRKAARVPASTSTRPMEPS